MYSRGAVPLLASALAPSSPAAGLDPASAASPASIVTWRVADVLGTPVVEGIIVNRDPTLGTL